MKMWNMGTDQHKYEVLGSVFGRGCIREETRYGGVGFIHLKR